MPHKGERQKNISRKIRKLKREGKTQDVAVAQAVNTVDRKKKKRGPKGARFE